MKFVPIFLKLTLLIVFISGCATPQRFYVIKEKVPTQSMQDIKSNNILIKKDASITVRSVIDIFIPIETDFPLYDDEAAIQIAIDKLLKKYNGDFLTNIRVKKESFFWLLIYGSHFYVTADVYKKGS